MVKPSETQVSYMQVTAGDVAANKGRRRDIEMQCSCVAD